MGWDVQLAQLLVMSALSIWSPWRWGIHMCLMFYSWNALCRKEVLTHWWPAPSSGELWEGERISGQYLQWPFPLTGQRPMGKNWRRQTMNNRVQGWAMVPAQHVPLGHVDYIRLGVTERIKELLWSMRRTWGTCSENLHKIQHLTKATC